MTLSSFLINNKELSMAISNENVVQASQLIKKGANPNIQNQYGYIALMWTARNGHTEIVELLEKISNLNL